jgi:hypothetical protein
LPRPADLSEYNIFLSFQAGKDWYDEAIRFVDTDTQGVQTDSDWSSYAGVNVYFIPSGLEVLPVGVNPLIAPTPPPPPLVKFSTLNTPPEIAWNNPAQPNPGGMTYFMLACPAAQNALGEGNWDFTAYLVDSAGAETAVLMGVAEGLPVAGSGLSS